MRRLIVASALLATLLFGSLGLVLGAPPAAAAGPAASTTDFDRATSAIDFMLSAQRPDGSLDGSISETADLVIGTAAFGIDPRVLKTCSGVRAVDYLATAADSATVDAGKIAKAILAIDSTPPDPKLQAHDLTARLAAHYNATTGAYGDGATFTQALAVLAVHTHAPAKAVEYLTALQDTDGSWNFKSAANATAGDTNSTAIALMALASVGNHAGDSKALAWLHTQQLADGGFPYQNADTYGPPASDPDSDSLVIQAIVAAGEDPTAASWSKGAANALTHLRSTQAANGGFVFPGSPKPDALTTSQVLAGLARKPYGTPFDIVHAWTPRTDCPAPSEANQATPVGQVTPPPTDRAPGSTAPAPDPRPLLILVGFAALLVFPLTRLARRPGR